MRRRGQAEQHGTSRAEAARMRKGIWMNKAITDGVVFMPPAFEAGLEMWSSGDGTPGSPSYAESTTAAFVPADQDFGGALELVKAENVQKLRYMGETPLLPGCYLQVRARVKALGGALPGVRIAAWPGGAGGVPLPALPQTGPQVSLTAYGEVVEISAIIGPGSRTGVDLVWGRSALYAHIGLDLTGPNGGIVRIDDIEVEDVTSVFLRDMLSVVDVRDYGAVGDGTSDDSAAFEAADADAQGREVLVPAGIYRLAESVTFQSRVQFEGRVEMPDDKILALTKNFDLPSYIDAFGDDEELAFKKAFQALLNNAGHESLDLCGRLLGIRAPIDMQAAVANRTFFNQRRVIRNGQFSVFSGPAWDTEVVTSQARYAPADPKRLTNVQNVASIPVGALIEGNGVGREVYVRARNIAAQTLEISAPLYDADGVQVFTFRRFKYILDFSGFDDLGRMTLSDIEFQCSGECSAILLPPQGSGFALRDCFITRPKDRGITSHGEGCQGMLIDRCQFLSNESPLAAVDRQSIALNANANDVKLRNNRAVHFRHFAVVGGSSTIVTGNHWFQGDTLQNSPRMAGLLLTRTNNRGTINGNYVDNSFIEWSNEHDQAPEFSNEFSFSQLSVTDNTFLASHVAPWFNYFVIKPHGAGHFLNGLTVTGNSFRIIGTPIERVEGIDTSFADLDYNRFQNVTFRDNMFNNVIRTVASPITIEHAESTPSQAWTVEAGPRLPFNGWVQGVDAVVAAGPLRDASNTVVYAAPYYQAKQGPDNDQAVLRWETELKGTVMVTVRIDDPF